MNYYNEFDPNAAAWLRELIAQGSIPDGVVDERSITELTPTDLHGYTQCHFFAGIGGWSLALQLAGVPASQPLWTGSCPCQPFSSAGKQLGISDERHLWPVFAELVRQCRPPLIFGEQVASKQGREWFGGPADMPKLRSDEAILGVLRELKGADSEDVQGLLQSGVRSVEAEARISTLIRELSGLPKSEQSEGPSQRCEKSGEAQGSRLQLGHRGHCDDRCADPERVLPDVADPVQLGRWEDLGLPITGPDRQHARLCEGERQGDSLLPECDGKRVGDGACHESLEAHGCSADEPFSESPSEVECGLEEADHPALFAGVRHDLERMGYVTGCADLCAPCAGEIGEGRIVRGDQATWERVIIGHPHIRQRIYWIADGRVADGHSRGFSQCSELNGQPQDHTPYRDSCGGHTDRRSGSLLTADGLAHTERHGREVAIQHSSGCGETLGVGQADELGSSGPHHRMVQTRSEGSQGHTRHECDGSEPRREYPQPTGPAWQTGWTLLPCRDGKTRRSQLRLQPLVDGLPRGVVPSGDPGSPEYANATAEARAMRLKGYGNAIVPDLAAMFIRAAL